MPRILWPRTGRRRTGYSLVLGLVRQCFDSGGTANSQSSERVGPIALSSRSEPALSPTHVLAKTQPITVAVLYIKISTAIRLVTNVTGDFDALGLELIT